jgi:hypothetical protein
MAYLREIAALAIAMISARTRAGIIGQAWINSCNSPAPFLHRAGYQRPDFPVYLSRGSRMCLPFVISLTTHSHHWDSLEAATAGGAACMSTLSRPTA